VPYQIQNPQDGVIIAKLYGDLSTKEIQALNQAVVADYLSKKNQDFCLIYEVSELSHFPTDISGLRTASAPIASSKNVKLQIVTGVKSPVFNFLFGVIGQLFSQSLRKANTLEEALDIAAKLFIAP
jgi:hypothetical protein